MKRILVTGGNLGNYVATILAVRNAGPLRQDKTADS
jgi:hypothetical protein